MATMLPEIPFVTKSVARLASWCAILLLWMTLGAVLLSQESASSDEELGLIEGVVIHSRNGEPLEGVVVHSRNGEPLEGVVVGLNPADPGVENPGIRVTTGEDGVFTLEDVPAGRYIVTATRSGFISSGASVTNLATIDLTSRAITVVAVDRESRIEGIRIPLVPIAAISGRVLEEDGERTIRSVVLEETNGALGYRLSQAQGGLSGPVDSDGRFRLANVRPGEYYLVLFPERGPGIYYPGVMSSDDAIPITIQPGDDIADIDISLPRRQTYRIYLNLASPLPENLGFSLRPRSTVYTSGRGVEYEQTGGNGYVLRGIPAGEYYLEILWLRQKQRIPVDVGQADVHLGTVFLAPGTTIEGRMVFDGISLESLGENSRLQVNLSAVPMGNGNAESASTNPDFTFALGPVSAGNYMIQAGRGFPLTRSPDLYIAAARYAGRDILGSGFTVEEGRPAEGILELVLSGPAGAVEGFVRAAYGEPLTGARVVLVPEENRRGNPDLFLTGVADQTGRFRIEGVPPGLYRVLAGSYTLAEAFLERELVRDLESRMTAVNVIKGRTSFIDAFIIPRPERD